MIYYHYKNKPYRLIVQARHSDTLEELTVYECLYDSPGGRYWVRPKTMFQGEVEIEGQTRQRFRPAQIDIELVPKIEPQHLRWIQTLWGEEIKGRSIEQYADRLRAHSKVTLFLARIEGELAGYKLGYEVDAQTYYSWEGCISRSYRKMGLATRLMDAQHEWCRNQGYKKVQTKSQNRFRPMMILNLKCGFEVVGLEAAKNPTESKILFEKRLA